VVAAVTVLGSVQPAAPSLPAGGAVTVLAPGVQTTVQDLPGRRGLWGVGVPPSGAWDELSFALANAAVGNPSGAPGLEAVLAGPRLRFARRGLVCLAGAVRQATLDGRPVPAGVVTSVPAGGVLDVGPCGPPGVRGYLAVAGGVRVPAVLGSRATFLLGGFGGHHGRALAAGDVLALGSAENAAAPLDVRPLLPELRGCWRLRVLPGPHGAPEHLTGPGVAAFFAATWTVDHRADRTGVRLVGPAPGWARPDGGEAGLHPSNIHDSAYPVGGIMLAGDTPVIVGPDGPSLGGFVVPCAVIRADRWMLGQLRPGDTVRLVSVTLADAHAATEQRRALLADVRVALAAAFVRSLSPDPAVPQPQRASAPQPAPYPPVPRSPSRRPRAVPARPADAPVWCPAAGTAPELSIRPAGDHHLLLEAGPPALDLGVRLWVHLLASALRRRGLPGVAEIVEGVRSLLVQVEEDVLPLAALAGELSSLAAAVPDPATVTLAVREVTLPIALDHPEAHQAMARYTRTVRPDAPWCPDNVEFIRRVNDLATRADVFDILTAATYLVVGLGDVYLGAPVAVPIDPRHRLVTTKYDPARTWTPANAVGIGGVYLCVYGMEGPGGYQLLGRTVPVWRYAPGTGTPPWLLRQFDRLRFRPVSAEELAGARADIAAGRADLQTRPASFGLAEVAALEAEHATEIAAFRSRRQAAFDAERARWNA
jgi:urea carboxylase